MRKGQKSIDQKVQESVFTETPIDKEQLKKLLVNEIQSMAVFVNEIMSIPAAIDALAEVYYSRYMKFYEKKNQVPDSSTVPASLTMLDDEHSGPGLFDQDPQV